MKGVVRAAGGVVLRDGPAGAEVVLVHRPRYDDWTLPKGKAQALETDEECALREVEEETGLVCELGREIDEATYVDSKGRPKTVRYWMMRAVSGEFRAHDEVDAMRWLPLTEAAALLSYDRDRLVLGRLDA